MIKIKEMVVDYRKRRTEHTPILINRAVVEQVESFNFLGVHITSKLTRFGMGPQILKRFYSWASRVAQWARALYCSASCATRDSGFAPRLCHNPAATGRSVGRRKIGIASLGSVWTVGISLSHRAPVTPVAGRAQCTLTKVARCTVFPPTHWCGWLPGWMHAVLRSSAA